MALISLTSLALAFGGAPVFDNCTLHIEPGDRLCLLGRNGCGKSTLLKVINGDLAVENGTVVRRQGIRTALVSQEIPPELTGSVADIVVSGHQHAVDLLADYHHTVALLAALPVDGQEYGALMMRMDELQHRLEETGAWEVHQSAEWLMNRFRLDPAEEFASLSGGTKRRVLLARALVSSPDILLLDEPTNHLDLDTILQLEEYIAKEVPTVVFVTHDRALARQLATRVAELDRGRIYCFPCGYDAFIERREELLEAEVIRQAQFDKKLAQEEVWIRKGIKARRTRNEGRVRALKKLREEFRQRRDRLGTAQLRLQEGEQSGKLVVQAEQVSFAYDKTPIIRNLSLTVLRGDKIGIIGPNGAGKSTLLKLLLGELSPAEGSIRLGTKREVLYFDQMREQLELDKSVVDNVGEGNDTLTINGRPRHVIGYLQDFLFSPERARSPVGILSGGERNRLLLAKLFSKPANVLVMDEPTNDLDMETLDLLEQLLVEFQGTLLLVSHDREFLNNSVTSTLVVRPDGQVREYAGGYDDWLRQSALEQAAQESQTVSSSAEVVQKSQRRGDRPQKLSFKETKELEQLPERIAELETEQARLQQILMDPAFYKSAGGEVVTVQRQLEETEHLLHLAYSRWEELEIISSGVSG